MAKRKTKVEPDVFSLTLKIGDTSYHSEGETVVEALKILPHPEKIFVKGVLTVTYRDKKRELPMMPVQIKRLFYPMAQSYMAKSLAFGMK